MLLASQHRSVQTFDGEVALSRFKLLAVRGIFAALITLASPGLFPGSASAQQMPNATNGSQIPLTPNLSVSSSCASDTQASATLDIVRQAYSDLNQLYFQSFNVSIPLSAARDAADNALGSSASSSTVSDWSSFQRHFCSAWTARGKRPDNASVAHPAIVAMLNAMDDPHTQFYSPDDYQDFVRSQTGGSSYVGIGVEIKPDPLSISRVMPGGGAEQAGLSAGDRILAINGQTAVSMKPSDAIAKIKGQDGTTVQLTIASTGNTDPRSVDVRRAPVRIPSIQSDMLGTIAYLRIEEFYSPDLPNLVLPALQSFRSQAAQGLILDLRGNPGGRLDLGVQVAGYFLPAGAPVYQLTHPGSRTQTATATTTRAWDKPVVVLVDDGTASMGEILASALREDIGAQLVGTKTSGAVAASQIFPLTDGSAVQITTDRIDSGKGAILNRIGLAPDLSVNPIGTATPAGTTAPDQTGNITAMSSNTVPKDQALNLALTAIQGKITN